jgi:hypothetical protein
LNKKHLKWTTYDNELYVVVRALKIWEYYLIDSLIPQTSFPMREIDLRLAWSRIKGLWENRKNNASFGG